MNPNDITKIKLIDVLKMIEQGKLKKGTQVIILSTGEVYTYRQIVDDEHPRDLDLFDKDNCSIFENNYLTTLSEMVDIREPAPEKVCEIEELRVDIVDSDGDLDENAIFAIINKVNEIVCYINKKAEVGKDAG